MAEKTGETRPFMSADGLAGDATLVKRSIKKREDVISSLEAKIAELKDACAEERRALCDAHRAVEAEIMRQIAEIMRQIAEIMRQAESLQQSLYRELASAENKRIKEVYDVDGMYKARRAPLHEQIAKLRALNLQEKQLIAPIRKLPAELLGYVFRYYVELGQSPWLLMLVSRSWRQTAETTPALWTHLCIGDWEGSHSSRIYYHCAWVIDGERMLSSGRMTVCRNVDELQLVIYRSGTLYIDISVSSSVGEANISMIKATLASTDVASRIAHLTINLSPENRMQVEDMALSPLPALRSLNFLNVNEAFGAHLLDHVSSFSPQMVDLQVFRDPPLSPKYSIWASLERLAVGCDSFSGYASETSFSEFDQLIPHLKQLKRLDRTMLYWPNKNTLRQTALSTLTHLTVACHPEHLERLNLPSLLHLVIKELNRRNTRQPVASRIGTIVFPALTTLKVTHANPQFWFRALSAPVMKSMVLKSIDKGAIFSTSHNITFPSVVQLILGACASTENIAAVLKCIPNVKEVNLAVHWDNKYCAVPILQRLAGDGEDVLCPQITSFTLGDFSMGILGDNTDVTPLIRKVIKRRRGNGVVMDHFEVHWEPLWNKRERETIQYA